MTRIFFLIQLSWLSYFAIGQNVEQKIQKFVNNQRIDSFITYSYPCIGGAYLFDTCRTYDTHYLFWVKDSKYYVQQFKPCKTSKTISIDSINPLLFYINNKQTIDTEKIRPPTYYDYKKKKNRIDTIEVITTISHSCHHTFSFNLKSKSIIKSVDIFNLDFINFDTGQKNIYYDYNQKSKLKNLIDDITKVTDKVDKELQIEVD
jgi:hypothetical protein